MEIEQRIEAFNKKNAPFYIVSHDNSKFSLCLPMCFLPDEYLHFGQKAFNRYSELIGEPICENGLFSHGNGFEWEYIFKKVFENDPHINQIEFDCEMDGFFCNANGLVLLEDFGSRFRNVCMNEKAFTELVCTALLEKEAEEERQRNTVRGFLKECSIYDGDIITPDGLIHLTSEQGQQILNGNIKTVKIGGIEVASEKLLDQIITHGGLEPFDFKHFKIKTREPEEIIEQNIGLNGG